MKHDSDNTFAEQQKRLADMFARSQKVTQFNDDSENEAYSLAHTLIDIDESSKKISNELLPMFSDKNLSPEQIEDILLDIGEELRHILYHIKDSRFYNYLD